MAAGRLLLPSWMPALDSDGVPISNAKVFFYNNLTTILAPVFSDEALTIPLANPVEANASGRFPAVWADDAVLYSASVEAPYGPAGVPFTYDNLSASMAADILVAGAAEAAADEAAQSLTDIEAAIQAAQDADGSAAVAGAIAGQAAGEAAAEAVLFDKAEADLSNVLSSVLGAKPILPSGATVSLELAQLLGLAVHPEHFGAVAGVFNNTIGEINKAAFTAAANAGVILEGGGRTYAIYQNWTPPASGFVWQNLNLRQTDTVNVTYGRTIYRDGIANVTMNNVTIDQNGTTHTTGLNNCAGMWFLNGSDIKLNRVRVINGTTITGIRLQSCIRTIAIDCEAANFEAMFASSPSDDVMQGFLADNCTDSVFVRCGGRNLTANWTGRPAAYKRYSRGIAISGCENCYFDAPFGHFVDQGIDVSGSVGNKALHISNWQAYDCTTWGFKIANHNQYINVNGGLAVRPGWGGVVVSAAADQIGLLPMQCKISNVMVLDCGAGGVWPSNRNAFSILSSTLGFPGYPGGVDFVNCFAYDRQATKTTDRWFAVLDRVAQAVDSTVPLNRLINCGGDGLAAGGTPQIGFDFSDALTTGTGNQTLTTATWTTVAFNAEVYDPANVVSGSRIYVKEPGRYLLTASVSFNQNATGYRQLRIVKNGSELPLYTRSAPVFPTAVQNASADMNRTVTANRGDYFEIQAIQTSGADLAISLASCQFELVKLHDLF